MYRHTHTHTHTHTHRHHSPCHLSSWIIWMSSSVVDALYCIRCTHLTTGGVFQMPSWDLGLSPCHFLARKVEVSGIGTTSQTHTHTHTHTPIHNKWAALFILLIWHKVIACTCTQIHTHNTDSVQMQFLAQRRPRAPLSRPFVLCSYWWRCACWRCLPEKLTDNSQTPPSSLCVYAWSFTDRLREHVCALIILIHWLWLIVCVLTRIHELYVNSMTWRWVGLDCSVLTLSTTVP